MIEITEKLAYLSARVEYLQKEASRLREDNNTGNTELLERVLTEIQRLKNETDQTKHDLTEEINSVKGEVSRHRRLVTSVRAVLYVLAAIMTFRFGDVPEILTKYWGS